MLCRLSPSTASRDDILIAVLEQSYEGIRSVYATICQWTVVVGAAWAALVTFGVHNRSGLPLVAAGVAVGVLAYVVNVAGKAMGALLVAALSAEKQLGLSESQGVAAAFFRGFRGRESLEELWLLTQEAAKPGSTRVPNKPAQYSVFHTRRSRTALLLWAVAIAQIAATLVSIKVGYLNLI
jgi:hypothetical protein